MKNLPPQVAHGYKKLDDLYQQVTDHLAGRPVLLRWQHPIAANANGMTSKSLSGQPVIDVNPALTDLDTLQQVWLHEIVHVRKHLDILTPSEIHQEAPHSVAALDPDEWPDPAEQSDIEAEAERTARKWMSLANAAIWRYPNLTTEAARLTALLTINPNI